MNEQQAETLSGEIDWYITRLDGHLRETRRFDDGALLLRRAIAERAEKMRLTGYGRRHESNIIRVWGYGSNGTYLDTDARDDHPFIPRAQMHARAAELSQSIGAASVGLYPGMGIFYLDGVESYAVWETPQMRHTRDLAVTQ